MKFCNLYSCSIDKEPNTSKKLTTDSGPNTIPGFSENWLTMKDNPYLGQFNLQSFTCFRADCDVNSDMQIRFLNPQVFNYPIRTYIPTKMMNIKTIRLDARPLQTTTSLLELRKIHRKCLVTLF